MLGAPITTLLVIAGLMFLLIAVVGNVAGKIEPGKTGRVVSGVIGAVLLTTGLTLTAFRLDDRAGRDAADSRQAAEAEAKQQEEKRRLAAEAEARKREEERRRQAAAEERRRAAEEARLAGTVRMPNLVGMNMREADAILVRVGLTHRGGRSEYYPRAAPGTVLSQMPAAGQTVRLDTRVTLTFASEFNRRIPVRSISSDAEARTVCPAACARASGKWSGRWFADRRGDAPAFFCGCVI